MSVTNFLNRKKIDIDTESSKSIILVDMDNTIVDYSTSIAIELKKIYPNDNVTSDNWQTLKLNDIHYNRKIIQSQPSFFKKMQPIEGSIKALKEMEQLGYTVFIVSSPSVIGNNCHSEKCDWMKQHFGEKWARRLVLTKDKTIVIGNVLIDDKPYITGAIDNPIWKHITFAQPYNIDLHEEHRVHLMKWDQWKNIVIPMLPNK